MTTPDIQAELANLFGYREFRPYQAEVISATLAGRDSFTIMPTGGGKSLCYQLPARLMDGVCVVVSPLISLMKDQVDAATATGLKAVAFNSASSMAERERARAGLLSGDLDLVYVSPERLAVPEFMDLLQRSRLSFFAIDEAHCISQWGHDFRPDYLELSRLSEIFPDTPLAAFTATATERVRRDIVERLALRDPLLVRASFNRPNLFYEITPKGKLDKQLLDFLAGHEGPGIIYRTTRKDVEATTAFLNRHGIPAQAYHAGLADVERAETQEAFRQDRCPVIVATIAFGMGIDKPNVRFVLHGDLPKNIEGYYQETGRAGRDGEPATCAMFYGRKDMGLLLTFARQVEDEAAREAALAQVYAMADFTGRDTCRRKGLLAYFGETYPEENCGACDICTGRVQREDATVAAQKLLSAMVRTGCRFGAQYIIDIVLGKTTPRIMGNGHDRLPTFGCGGEAKADYWRRVMDAMLVQGFICVEGDEYPTLAVTETGWEVLRNGRECSLIKAAERKQTREARRAERLGAGGEAGGRAGSAGAADLDAAGLELYELLRGKRLAIARAAGLPPFMVFADRTLRDMARQRPLTPAGLLEVSGVGRHKLATYGEEFLEAIRDFRTAQGEDVTALMQREEQALVAANPRPRSQPDNTTGPGAGAESPGGVNSDEDGGEAEASSGRQRGDSRRETARLLARGLSIAEVVEARGLKAASILRHMEELVQEEGAVFEPAQFMRLERYDYARQLFRLCEDARLTPVVELSQSENPVNAGQAPLDFDEAHLARVLLNSEANRTGNGPA